MHPWRSARDRMQGVVVTRKRGSYNSRGQFLQAHRAGTDSHGGRTRPS